MKYLQIIMEDLRSVTTTLKNNYKSNRSAQNANALMNAVDRLYDMAVYSCEYARDFADTIANGGILSNFNDTSGAENLKKSCDNIKKSLVFSNDVLYNWQMTYLFDKHPVYFEYVYGSFDDFIMYIIPATDMYFNEYRYIIGMEDTVMQDLSEETTWSKTVFSNTRSPCIRIISSSRCSLAK